MKSDSRIYVAGHTGLVGSAIVRRLRAGGFENLITRPSREVNLCDAGSTGALFAQERPEYVFIAAARVGGIHANNTYPADFLQENVRIQTNLFDAAHRHGATKLLFLGSSCIYPREAPQPMREEHLLTGLLELTNEAYAIAKISGIVACRSFNRQHGARFIAAMPTNLYGPGDNFDLKTGHVLPALIRKFHLAKKGGAGEVEVWGTGASRREFLFVDDLADACVFLMERFEPTPERVFLNVGLGRDITIAELAELVREVVGFGGEIRWNHNMPDGTPRKLLAVDRLTEMGWRAKTPLREGIERTYEWFLAHIEGVPA